eukprot:6461204-Alexandrium_andersonii.AAC.1
MASHHPDVQPSAPQVRFPSGRSATDSPSRSWRLVRARAGEACIRATAHAVQGAPSQRAQRAKRIG